MTSVPEIGEAMKRLLTETAQRLGRETRFVQRASKLDGAAFAQTCVWGWRQHPDASLSQLCQTAASAGGAIRPQGLDQRFDAGAATFLRRLLEEASHLVMGGNPTALPLLARFTAVQIEDSTTIGLPDELAAIWQGCGDAVGGHVAALKVQAGLDVLSGTLHRLLLAHGRASDRTLVSAPTLLPPGALALTDLGYFAVARLVAIARQGAFFLSRWQAATAVFDGAGRRLLLEEWLGQEAALQVERTVQLGMHDHLPVRLVAARVSQEVADQRRRRLQADARRKGHTLPARRLVLADWTILVTNAPPDKLTADETFTLARVRWQIELLFRLWKDQAHLDQWRTAKTWRILGEVYAKLLGVLLQHWLIVASCWAAPDRSLVRASATIQDHAPLLIYGVQGKLDLTTILTLLAETLHACPPIQRRAKRPATFQLLAGLHDAA